jgi:hypothetical protein
MRQPTLTAERLRELIDYDPLTGVLVRRVTQSHNARAGDTVGTVGHGGRLSLAIDSRTYLAHRLAWLWVTGSWPNRDLDHINGRPDDNRWANLREADKAENQQNRRRARSDSRSGYMGVRQRPGGGWSARITLQGRQLFLGRFATAEGAHSAYLAAKRRLHPYGTI